MSCEFLGAKVVWKYEILLKTGIRVCLLLFKVNFWILKVWFMLVFYNAFSVRIYHLLGNQWEKWFRCFQ